jgi:hypothetical protein
MDRVRWYRVSPEDHNGPREFPKGTPGQQHDENASLPKRGRGHISNQEPCPAPEHRSVPAPDMATTCSPPPCFELHPTRPEDRIRSFTVGPCPRRSTTPKGSRPPLDPRLPASSGDHRRGGWWTRRPTSPFRVCPTAEAMAPTARGRPESAFRIAIALRLHSKRDLPPPDATGADGATQCPACTPAFREDCEPHIPDFFGSPLPPEGGRCSAPDGLKAAAHPDSLSTTRPIRFQTHKESESERVDPKVQRTQLIDAQRAEARQSARTRL